MCPEPCPEIGRALSQTPDESQAAWTTPPWQRPLTDRRTTPVSMITLWDSGDAMRASAQEADQLGERTADISDQKIANVAQYDVSMAQTVEGARA